MNETLIYTVGLAFALFVIWRMATRKTRHKARGGGEYRGGGGFVIGIPGQADGPVVPPSMAGPMLGSIVAVNLLGVLYLAAATASVLFSGVGLGFVVVFAGMAVYGKVSGMMLDAAPPADTFGLWVGNAVMGLCMVGWMMGVLWLTPPTVELVRGVLHG